MKTFLAGLSIGLSVGLIIGALLYREAVYSALDIIAPGEPIAAVSAPVA